MTVNDKEVKFLENMNIIDLINIVKCDDRFSGYHKFKFNVMINDEIIDRNKYDTIILKENDEIIIIPLMAGG